MRISKSERAGSSEYAEENTESQPVHKEKKRLAS